MALLERIFTSAVVSAGCKVSRMTQSQKCPESLVNEFAAGAPKFHMFKPGERVYKLVSIPINRERIVSSPWWIRETEFDRLRGLSHRERKPLADVIRRHLAIATRWSPGLDGLCILQLALHKAGWVGPARPQTDIDEELVGWGEQACIPEIGWRDVWATKLQVPFHQSGEYRPLPLPWTREGSAG